jgi:hypothetical protein
MRHLPATYLEQSRAALEHLCRCWKSEKGRSGGEHIPRHHASTLAVASERVRSQYFG